MNSCGKIKIRRQAMKMLVLLSVIVCSSFWPTVSLAGDTVLQDGSTPPSTNSTYQLLAPDVLGSGNNTNVTSFSQYANLFFTSLLALIIVLAVLMIVWGGIEYMLSDTPLKIASSKSRIWSAIGGLLLALLSYLILYSIDPSIVNWKNNSILSSNLSTPAPAPTNMPE